MGSGLVASVAWAGHRGELADLGVGAIRATVYAVARLLLEFYFPLSSNTAAQTDRERDIYQVVDTAFYTLDQMGVNTGQRLPGVLSGPAAAALHKSFKVASGSILAYSAWNGPFGEVIEALFGPGLAASLSGYQTTENGQPVVHDVNSLRERWLAVAATRIWMSAGLPKVQESGGTIRTATFREILADLLQKGVGPATSRVAALMILYALVKTLKNPLLEAFVFSFAVTIGSLRNLTQPRPPTAFVEEMETTPALTAPPSPAGSSSRPVQGPRDSGRVAPLGSETAGPKSLEPKPPVDPQAVASTSTVAPRAESVNAGAKGVDTKGRDVETTKLDKVAPNTAETKPPVDPKIADTKAADTQTADTKTKIDDAKAEGSGTNGKGVVLEPTVEPETIAGSKVVEPTKPVEVADTQGKGKDDETKDLETTKLVVAETTKPAEVADTQGKGKDVETKAVETTKPVVAETTKPVEGADTQGKGKHVETKAVETTKPVVAETTKSVEGADTQGKGKDVETKAVETTKPVELPVAPQTTVDSTSPETRQPGRRSYKEFTSPGESGPSQAALTPTTLLQSVPSA